MIYLKTYFSPFKPLTLEWYIGKIAIGTPYFLPRRMIKSKKGSLIFVPRKLGFNFVNLGWKTKWKDTDYRFEWSPVWSFVFFKWQIAVTFIAPHMDHYWECWLYYTRNTDKSKSVRERLIDAKKEFPCIWVHHGEERQEICYWDLILKQKYLK